MQEKIAENSLRTALLFIIFFALAIALGFGFGYLFWDSPIAGSILVGVLAFAWALISLVLGDRVVLAVSRAKEAQRKDYPDLFRSVENLAMAAGIPIPKVYVMSSAAMNAFATGMNPEKSSVAVTTGLLKKLSKNELEGVIAHELSHIKHRDVRLAILTSVLVGVFSMVSHMALNALIFGGRRDRSQSPISMAIGLVLIILSPIIAQLISLAISREREFMADAGSAVVTHNPGALASALGKISGDPNVLATASAATAHLFIANPFKKGFFLGLFSTHPPVVERIRRLQGI